MSVPEPTRSRRRKRPFDDRIGFLLELVEQARIARDHADAFCLNAEQAFRDAILAARRMHTTRQIAEAAGISETHVRWLSRRGREPAKEGTE